MGNAGLHARGAQRSANPAKTMAAKLAITCGDPAGVGPEIIAAWLAANPADASETAVVGPAAWLDTLRGAATKIPVGLENFAATPGAPDGEGSLVAWGAMERAAAGCVSGEFSGVVTGPVSKERLARIGYAFPGQTEFFAARWGGEPVMAFCGGRLRVVLATWHIPLHQVARSLGPNLFRRAVPTRERADCWAVKRSNSSIRPSKNCAENFRRSPPANPQTRCLAEPYAESLTW
jgi:4-hydroxy-L-threonine phosphate dehydrogenase PdxA